MNRRMVFYTLGQMVCIEAALLMLPFAVSLIYWETKAIAAFGITVVLAALLGILLMLCCRTKNRIIYAKEGFVIVALTWITVSLVGAVPFVLSGDIPSYVDAFFETASGFTTTGSSILEDVEALCHGVLFWRSFTHWVGGMGVLVFIMAIVPVTDRSIHIMRAEMPGPIVGKLVPKVKDTAKILYLIYIGITVAEMIFLWAGDMNFFESVVHSFGTAGTGGFGIKGDSIGGYSAYSQWVITIFMAIFGVNFNLYYLILIKKVKDVLKSTELWAYISVMAASVAIISVNIYNVVSHSISETVRLASFQVASIVTTTGYATDNFNNWPVLSKSVIFVLMFLGGCAGSTAGGLKMSRVMLLFKMMKNEFRHLIHPRSVSIVKLEGKQVEAPVLHSASNYFSLYVLCMGVIFLLLSFDPGGFDLETNITATITCFNNVGPGLGKFIGPAGNFSQYSCFSKVVLSFAMLFGRLEILPMMIAFIPSTWTKR